MSKGIKPFLVLPLLLLSSCASKQDLLVVSDDLRKLKSDAETVKSQSAGSYTDVQQLRDEVLRLQGLLEEMGHTHHQEIARLGVEDSLLINKVDELESRVQKIEKYPALAKFVSKVSSPPLKPNDALSTDKKQELPSDAVLLKDGLDKLLKKSHAAARESFSALVKSYPKSDLADDAQFHLADSYFSEKWYEKAILEYQAVIAKYPKSNKRPAALYKQALSFEAIGDAQNAKARFKDLLNVYPASPEADLVRKRK
jgi:tol-pal system protein YbgF